MCCVVPCQCCTYSAGTCRALPVLHIQRRHMVAPLQLHRTTRPTVLIDQPQNDARHPRATHLTNACLLAATCRCRPAFAARVQQQKQKQLAEQQQAALAAQQALQQAAALQAVQQAIMGAGSSTAAAATGPLAPAPSSACLARDCFLDLDQEELCV